MQNKLQFNRVKQNQFFWVFLRLFKLLWW